ncbi:MAG: glycosyltransferase family 2 protein [Flavobacterium sp.]|nr:glycosyltransferase family 2 protein [Flavobacterium sp.]
MIVVVHDSKYVIQVIGLKGSTISFQKKAIGEILFSLAKKYPNETLAWCSEKVLDNFDSSIVSELLHHNKMILSFNPNEQEFLGAKFGYIDHASILKINKKVLFFTWQLSSIVGVTKASLLNEIVSLVPNKKENFTYLLQSLAIRVIQNGLFCYSEPRLLKEIKVLPTNTSSNFTLFKFVKQHKSFKWLLILFFNILLYERKIAFFPFIYSLFFFSRKWNTNGLDSIDVNSNKKVIISKDIDVIVPTIGRSKHVYKVLCDLRNQTHLPKKVIVVEQNPLPNSTTELHFIKEESWPFIIDHTFTHQSGACNARNIALSKVTSEWTFMCDDDNQFEPSLIEGVYNNIEKYGVEALSTAYPQVNEIITYNRIHQTTIFGSGNSFIKSVHLKKVQFDDAYEFCYGEDFDFGMQLRNIGVDVVYFPKPHITHLKVPMGGFRTKPILKWSYDSIPPIPSPAILLNYLKYRNIEQLNAYKNDIFL